MIRTLMAEIDESQSCPWSRGEGAALWTNGRYEIRCHNGRPELFLDGVPQEVGGLPTLLAAIEEASLREPVPPPAPSRMLTLVR